MYKKVLCTLLAIVMFTAAFSGCNDIKEDIADKLESTATTQIEATPNKTEDATKIEEATIKPYPGELTSILLMGSMNGDFSDENNQNYALTHILITIDPTTRSMRFTTFPYNLKIKPSLEADIPEIQLQFLYAQYGADVVVDTLSERFGVDIDGWVVMNMDGVKKIVDDIGGIEIDILDTSINDMAQTVESILGYVWQEIKKEGKQILNGIQITGFFMDTYNDLDEENPAIDEEEKFRKKHRIIIDSFTNTIKALKMDDKQLVETAHKVKDNFLTNINEKDWDNIAKMAVACIENEQTYYHVPEVIVVEKDERMRSIVYDEVKDVKGVSEFVSGE